MGTKAELAFHRDIRFAEHPDPGYSEKINPDPGDFGISGLLTRDFFRIFSDISRLFLDFTLSS